MIIVVAVKAASDEASFQLLIFVETIIKQCYDGT